MPNGESIGDILRRRRLNLLPSGPSRVEGETTPRFFRGQPLVPAANIQATPAFDVERLVEALTPKRKPPTIRERIAAGLEAAGAAIQATPAEAGEAPVLGGIVGGIGGIGEVLKRRRARRAKAEEPARELRGAITEEAIRQRVREPFRQAEEARRQAGRSSLLRERFGLSSDLARRRATQRAGTLKLSVNEAKTVYDEAQRELFFQGVFPDTPGYQTLLDTRANDKARQFRELGARALTPRLGQPAPPTQRDDLGKILGF